MLGGIGDMPGVEKFDHPLEKPADCSKVQCDVEPHCHDDLVLAQPTHSCCPRCSYPDDACRGFESVVRLGEAGE